MNELSGTMLGAYQLREPLGRGGMATVYRANQLTVGRDVAVKVLSPDLADEPEFISRFEHEARVVAGLQHPNIVAIHDFGRVGPLTYLVMRLMEGGSLDRELRRGPLPNERVIQIAGQVAAALDYAHGRGIVHRDLKPTNVLLDAVGNASLTDFGIAKLVTGGPVTGLTAAGTVMGTPTYMAPEQWRSEPVDARTDVYALGVLIYQMLTGRVPFASETPHGLMYQHLDADPPPPRTIRPDLPLAVEPVIRKALAKNRRDRYASAGELVRDLENALRFPAQPLYDPLRAPRQDVSDLDETVGDEDLLAPRVEERPRVPVPRTVAPPSSYQPDADEIPPLAPYQPPIRRASAYPHQEEYSEGGHITRFVWTVVAVGVGVGVLFGVALVIALLFSSNGESENGEPTLPFGTTQPTDVPAELRPGVTITSPGPNTSVQLGALVPINFTAQGRQGITRVELRRFNQTIDVVGAGSQAIFSGTFTYAANSTGTHTLEVVPWSGEIRGNSASVTIFVQ